MKLIYNEIYGTGKDRSVIFPTITIIFNDRNNNILPNINKELIQEDDGFYFAHLSFDDGLLNCFSEIAFNKLQSLLSFSVNMFGNRYISKDIWRPFLFTSNIKLLPIKKAINQNITKLKGYEKFINEKKQSIIHQYYYDTNVPFDNNITSLQLDLYKKMQNEIITNDNNNTNKLRLRYKVRVPKENYIDVIDFMTVGRWGEVISISYEIEFDNELDLLYTFLDCLFSSEYNYKIKQCNKCNKFFITLKVDHLHCPTCRQIEIKSRKIKYESQEIVKLERKINSLYNSPYTSAEDRKKYLYDKMCKKIEFEGNEEALKNWYLSHYKNEETKKRNDYVVKK